jgi:hypothetical protein
MSQIYSCIELYMFGTDLLSIIRSLVLYSQQLVFVIQLCCRLVARSGQVRMHLT